MDYLTTHTSLSPIRRGFAPGFVNYKKWCTRLAVASDKVYQLLAHGCWFSPGTPASSTTKTGCHGKAEQSDTFPCSCGTVALYGPFYLFIFADHRATVFTLSKTFETAQKNSCAAFFANFCHEIECENDQTYISFR